MCRRPRRRRHATWPARRRPRNYLEDADPRPSRSASLRAHTNTLGLAKDKGARYSLASTSEVYGDPQGPPPQDESYWGHVKPPSGPGGSTTKPSASPRSITMGVPPGNTALTCALAGPFNTYGPRMRPGATGRVVSNFIVSGLGRRARLTVYGDGSTDP